MIPEVKNFKVKEGTSEVVTVIKPCRNYPVYSLPGERTTVPVPSVPRVVKIKTTGIPSTSSGTEEVVIVI